VLAGGTLEGVLVTEVSDNDQNLNSGQTIVEEAEFRADRTQTQAMRNPIKTP